MSDTFDEEAFGDYDPDDAVDVEARRARTAAGRYLTDLADVCESAGLVVREHGGWQTRARRAGGYSPGRPTHVIVHHTASPPSWDGRRDADYCAAGAPDAPLANLYLDRSGDVWVLAAGATNTNGRGHDSWGGGVPADSMNSYAIGIEAGNNGIGEPWPERQQDAYLAICRALMARYGIAVGRVRGHREWAPGRKVDPAGQSRWATGSAPWEMNRFRAAISAGSVPAPTVPPTAADPGPRPPIPTIDKETEMTWLVRKEGRTAVWALHSDGTRTHVQASQIATLQDRFGPPVVLDASSPIPGTVVGVDPGDV